MFSWFTRKKQEEPSQSIEKLHETKALLEKRQRILEKKCEQETEQAKKYLAQKNRTAAANCLKRKKNYEAQLKKLAEQQMNIETMIMKVEESVLNKEVLDATILGGRTLSGIHKEHGVDKIDAEMDKIRDTLADAQQISDALSTPLGTDVVDDDELLDELRGIEDKVNLEEQAKLDQINIKKDKIGTKTPSKTIEATPEEEEELARLMEA